MRKVLPFAEGSTIFMLVLGFVSYGQLNVCVRVVSHPVPKLCLVNYKIFCKNLTVSLEVVYPCHAMSITMR